ncbi:DUF4136 domain-containing protein [Microbulbifer flavimaris]|uniref:DUF4136 domain-containing protein n=1 Tax=Microbulbifer flavimaris TaxID=1781068 RepID=A0ABX4I3K8_9GAMM|nr:MULTISPECIES: DUF4136 domain-containing protein [Microbulbifer]KUJ84405.1 hypothetical protein AVO43_01505 [Microbulbifer sp. ZGT114]PCO06490.1 DUF4136 domain-containing protein [Microbulbifer flavimaris]
MMGLQAGSRGIFTAAAALAMSLFLAACAGSPTSSGAAAEGRWGQYRTFGFVPGRDSVRSSQVASILRSEVARQMNARGLTQSSNPDLLVHFAVSTEERVQAPRTRSTGAAAARYPFLEEYYRQLPPGHATDLNRVTEGRLTIDVLDVQQRQLVWRGRAERRVTPQMMTNPQPALSGAVNDIFRRFPKTN